MIKIFLNYKNRICSSICPLCISFVSDIVIFFLFSLFNLNKGILSILIMLNPLLDGKNIHFVYKHYARVDHFLDCCFAYTILSDQDIYA